MYMKQFFKDRWFKFLGALSSIFKGNKKYWAEISIVFGVSLFAYSNYLPKICKYEFVELNDRYCSYYDPHAFLKTFGVIFVIMGVLMLVKKIINRNNKSIKFSKKQIIGGIIGILFLFFIVIFTYSAGQVDIFAPDCNVQNIKLQGHLLTYRNYASDETGQISKDVASSEEIVNAINKANNNISIKAIILEIDSGGGSPVGGEEIAEALKKTTKPTVALIRDRGTSAAYMAATGAKYIVAYDNSDVGSIGVTMSYVDNYDKNKQDGLYFNQLSMGEYKDAGNPDKYLTKDEAKLFNRDIKIMYENFINTVAENRNLDADKVAELADGSSMLGQMAMDNGLIDQVGGVNEVEKYLEPRIGSVHICR